jgi:hypothetical protein
MVERVSGRPRTISPMRAVENALDDEKVAALFPFAQVSRDAV